MAITAQEKREKQRQREVAARRKAADRLAREQMKQSKNKVVDVLGSFRNEQNRLRGMLGAYGTLNSGVGGDILGQSNANAMRAASNVYTDMNAQLLANQLAGRQYEGSNQLAYDQLASSERETDARFGLERDRLGLDRDRFGLEAELGRGDLGLRRDTQMGDLSLRERQLAQQAAQAEADRVHQLALQTGQQGWQSGENTAGREHELALQTGTQAFQAGESRLGREHELGVLGKQQSFQSGESRLGREHELGVLGRQQAFQGGENAADRAQQTALQQGQQSWQSGESRLSREQEMALLAQQQQFSGGQNELDRAQQMALQTGQQEFTGQQNDLDRQMQQVRTDREFAAREAELAATILNNESNRGVQRDEMQMRAALELQRLAQERDLSAQNREMELARLAEQQRVNSMAGMSDAMRMGAAGLNTQNPLAAQYLEAAGFENAGSGERAPGYGGVPMTRQPGMSDYEWQIAQMSNYWNAQRAGQPQQPLFYNTAANAAPSDLDYYNAATARMNAVGRYGNAGSGFRGAGGGAAVAGGQTAVPQQDRRAVSHILDWIQTGRTPNVARATLQRGLQAAEDAGVISPEQADQLILEMGDWSSSSPSVRSGAPRVGKLTTWKGDESGVYAA